MASDMTRPTSVFWTKPQQKTPISQDIMRMYGLKLGMEEDIGINNGWDHPGMPFISGA